MGRAGRYTLSVMVWVATFALWTGVAGLLIAAVTGERLTDGDAIADSVPVGVSAVFLVLIPMVPTLVTLWFNDWARDGFPTRAERRAARAAADVPAPAPAEALPLEQETAPVAASAAPPPAVEFELFPVDASFAAPPPAPSAPAAPAAPVVVPPPPPVVPAVALGVPTGAASAAAGGRDHPVAPFLRDTPAAAPAVSSTSTPAQDASLPPLTVPTVESVDLAALTVPEFDPLTAPLTEVRAATRGAAEPRTVPRRGSDSDVAGIVDVPGE